MHGQAIYEINGSSEIQILEKLAELPWSPQKKEGLRQILSLLAALKTHTNLGWICN